MSESLREFIDSEVSRIKEEVESEVVRDFQHSKLAPIDDSGPEWSHGAKRYNGPELCFFVTQQEAQSALNLGGRLSGDGVRGAMKAAMRKVDHILFHGDPSHGWQGLFNSLPGNLSPPEHKVSEAPWGGMELQQVVTEIFDLLQGLHSASGEGRFADTLLLPTTLLPGQPLLMTRLKDYRGPTGEPLTVRAYPELDQAGIEGSRRVVAYVQDPAVFRLHLPTPPTFLPSHPVAANAFAIQGTFVTGGLKILDSSGFRYLDGI